MAVSSSDWSWVLVVLVLIAVIACGSNSLTVQEYAERTCGSDFLDIEDADLITNTEALDLFDDAMDELRSLTPPDELKAYHSLNVSLLSAWQETLRDAAEDEIFTWWSILLPSMVFSSQIEKAEENLSPETVAIMNEAGCDIEIDSVQNLSTPEATESLTPEVTVVEESNEEFEGVSVSVSGVGPEEGPFVLYSGKWNCETILSGNGDYNWAIINIGGRPPEGLGFYHEIVLEIIDQGMWEYVFNVGSDYTYGSGDYHLDYVTYYEIDVSQGAEWSITCEESPDA